MQLYFPPILYIGIPLLIALLILKSFMPKLLGHRGESIVRSRLAELDRTKYTVLNDLLIPNPKSKSRTSQIDHVVVSPYGLFVIETKNYSGQIRGKEKDAQWTQVNYRRKDRLSNPLRQNYGHVQAIKELLGESLSERFSEAVQMAADAAVNEVTPSSIADGRVVFDETQADSTFKTTLADNLDLNQTTLQPKPGTLFTQAPVIVMENCIDSSNTSSFPLHYVNSQYGINTEITGPSIVYVVDAQAPKPYRFSADITFQTVLIQAYGDG